VATLAFGAIGFADDYLKVVHRRNLGLTARAKLFLPVPGGHRCGSDAERARDAWPVLNPPDRSIPEAFPA